MHGGFGLLVWLRGRLVRVFIIDSRALNESDFVVAPAMRSLVSVESGFDSVEDALVHFVDLFFRSVFQTLFADSWCLFGVAPGRRTLLSVLSIVDVFRPEGPDGRLDHHRHRDAPRNRQADPSDQPARTATLGRFGKAFP